MDTMKKAEATVMNNNRELNARLTTIDKVVDSAAQTMNSKQDEKSHIPRPSKVPLPIKR